MKKIFLLSLLSLTVVPAFAFDPVNVASRRHRRIYDERIKLEALHKKTPSEKLQMVIKALQEREDIAYKEFDTLRTDADAKKGQEILNSMTKPTPAQPKPTGRIATSVKNWHSRNAGRPSWTLGCLLVGASTYFVVSNTLKNQNNKTQR